LIVVKPPPNPLHLALLPWPRTQASEGGMQASKASDDVQNARATGATLLEKVRKVRGSPSPPCRRDQSEGMVGPADAPSHPASGQAPRAAPAARHTGACPGPHVRQPACRCRGAAHAARPRPACAVIWGTPAHGRPATRVERRPRPDARVCALLRPPPRLRRRPMRAAWSRWSWWRP